MAALVSIKNFASMVSICAEGCIKNSLKINPKGKGVSCKVKANQGVELMFALRSCQGSVMTQQGAEL